MSAVKKSLVVEQLRRNQMIELLARGKRIDGRGLLDYRPIKIETGIIPKASGSARVTIGDTQVIAGIKVETGTPFPDTPDQGLLVVNAELLPISSPYAEPGPPDESAIELARVVDRGVRESQMIDVSQLVIKEGEKVYAVFADVSILNTDGNLLDTTSYAVVAAMLSAKYKKYEMVDGKLKQTDTVEPLPLKTIPVSVTMAKIGDSIIVDPTDEEEAVMDARLTLTSDSNGNMVAGQKGEPGTFSFDQMLNGADISRMKGEEIRKMLKEATGFTG
ncbi:MAG: exosome complex protein Rrp42 [Thaumarchaeota archaeon]|nr:exosome complex protein Rrp42 [Nitrososphaerota archaeon]